MRLRHLILASSVGLVLAWGSASAEPTEIVVRVIAKDAKFIGTETGGAKVVLRDSKTGKVLAEGLTQGATGNTPKIMTELHPRGTAVSDDTSAKFSANVDINQPTLVTATVTGPMILKENALTASSSQWVLPGKPIAAGDGWLIELPGFAIDLIDALPQTLKLNGAPKKLQINAKITMQCGCPITPGGLWDANKFEIGAIVYRGGKKYSTTPLVYAGKASTFSGAIEIGESGTYLIDLFAYSPSNGNTGVKKVSLTAR
jgi:hypothetical protein